MTIFLSDISMKNVLFAFNANSYQGISKQIAMRASKNIRNTFTVNRIFLFAFLCINRWYRAPELLYGAGNYDESVDLW